MYTKVIIVFLFLILFIAGCLIYLIKTYNHEEEEDDKKAE